MKNTAHTIVIFVDHVRYVTCKTLLSFFYYIACYLLKVNQRKICVDHHLLLKISNFLFNVPLPRLGFSFSECQQKWKIGIGHFDQMAPILQKIVIKPNFQFLTPPPKVWVSTFPGVNGNGKLVLFIMNGKNYSHFTGNCPRAKFPITQPAKFQSLSFPVSIEFFHN